MPHWPIGNSSTSDVSAGAIRSPLWAGAITALKCMLVAGLGLWIVHALSDRALMAGMRQHLADIATTTAGRIQVAEHQALAAKSDAVVPGSPEYESASRPLVQLRAEVADIYYAYTLTIRDGAPVFVLDSSYYVKNQGDEAVLAMPGEIYEEAPQELLDAWKAGKTVVSEDPYTDKWGTFISAFAPFRDPQGQLAGLVGIDISMSQLAERRAPVRLAVLLAALSCGLGSIGIGWLRYRADKRILQHETDLLVARADALSGERAARAGEQAKSVFLATMSHEIRTPLNGVLGMAEMLSQTKLNEAQREQVEAIRHSGQLLLVMLNDILDFSKIDAEAMSVHSEPVDLRAVVHDAVALHRGSAEAKGLAVVVDYPQNVASYVLADSVRTSQVLGNLLSNAIKFTGRGCVRIVVGPDQQHDGMVQIAIEDTGIGIPKGRLKDLFVPFSQLDSGLNRAAGGSGLGLVISRRLAELMGGGIEAASEEGKGSVFRFYLPITSETPAPKAWESDACPQAALHGRLKVLVAEDVEVNRRVIALMLGKIGIEASYANDGQEALDAWRAGRHDVILMDVQMPKLDGLEVTRRIRAESKDERWPWIITLTGGVMGDNQAKAAISGMNDFLAKPVSLAALSAAFSRVPQKSSG